MFKDDYKKAMSFPLREGLIRDTARLLEAPAPKKRQDRWVWGRNIALAALACLMVTLGVHYASMDSIGLLAGSSGGAAAPQDADNAPAASMACALDEGPLEESELSENSPAKQSDEDGIQAYQESADSEEGPLQLRSAVTETELCADVSIGLEEVRQLAFLGEDLDWAALERLTGVSSEGEIPVEGGFYCLRVGGTDPKEPPAYVMLYIQADPEVSIDIRYEDVEVFLAETAPEAEPEK